VSLVQNLTRDSIVGLDLSSVVDSVAGSTNCQWLHVTVFARKVSTIPGLVMGQTGAADYKKRLELTGLQSSFCQRLIRLAPPHRCVLLPEQADVHSPGLRSGMYVKLLPQRQSRPNSIPKYLYGALRLSGVLIVQNLLLYERFFSNSRLGRIVCSRFAALLCQRCVTGVCWAPQQTVSRG
jgi:hypothetical protein